MVSMESLDAKSGQAQMLAPTPKQLEQMFQAADKDKSGALDLLQFASMECHEGQTLGDIKAVFDFLDSDGDGTLSREEFAAFEAARIGSSAGTSCPPTACTPSGIRLQLNPTAGEISTAPGTPLVISAGNSTSNILFRNTLPVPNFLARKNPGSEEGQVSAAAADGAGITNRTDLGAARKVRLLCLSSHSMPLHTLALLLSRRPSSPHFSFFSALFQCCPAALVSLLRLPPQIALPSPPSPCSASLSLLFLSRQ
jgi:hypothetical protein